MKDRQQSNTIDNRSTKQLRNMARTHQASNKFLNAVGTRETRVETAKKRQSSIQPTGSSNFMQSYTSNKREKSYRQDNATTGMNESAPSKYNKSIDHKVNVPSTN